MRKWSVLVALCGALVVGCSSSDDPPPPAPVASAAGQGATNQKTFSGTVLQPGGIALPGATVSLEISNNLAGAADLTAVTDLTGNFVIQDPPPGTFPCHIDGSTSPATGRFGSLEVVVDIAAAGDSTFQNAITLPNLAGPNSAEEIIAVDAAGMATATTTIGSGDTSVTIQAGTLIQIDGSAATGPVTINITPVPTDEIPMTLPPTINSNVFVTIQPPNATFSPGLDICLPNPDGLALATDVDIWSFDHDARDWVNRSAQTGNQGTVVDDGGTGTKIQASAVITKGGWHPWVLPARIVCNTTFTGRVVYDSNGTLVPVSNAILQTSTGQAGRTNLRGGFTINNVTAFNLANTIACDPISVDVDVQLPVGMCGDRQTTTVAAGSIVINGITPLGDIIVAPQARGSLAGLVTDNGSRVGGQVTITGPVSTTVALNQGGFFLSCLIPGNYTASYRFKGEVAPRSVAFTIVARRITTINIQRLVSGAGTRTIEVCVLFDKDDRSDTPLVPLAGAVVSLVDSNQTLLAGTTDLTGRLRFEGIAAGDTNVSAQVDLLVENGDFGLAFRAATSVTHASGDLIALPIFAGNQRDLDRDATLTGAFTKQVVGFSSAYRICASARDECNVGFENSTSASPKGGNFKMSVASGVVFDVVLEMRNQQDDVTGFLVIPNQGPISSGGSLNILIDPGSPNFVSFDQQVSVDFQNLPDAKAAQSFASLDVVMNLPNGGNKHLQVFGSTEITSGPINVDLPNMALLPGGSGIVSGDVEVFDLFSPILDATDLECTVPITGTTPATVALPFPNAPILVSPGAGEFVDLDDTNDLEIEFDFFGAVIAGTAPNGVNIFFVGSHDGDGTPDGFDGTQWTLFAPSHIQRIELPAIALPMFGEGMMDVGAGPLRVTGLVINYNTLFGCNFGETLRLLDTVATVCQGDAMTSIFVGFED